MRKEGLLVRIGGGYEEIQQKFILETLLVHSLTDELISSS